MARRVLIADPDQGLLETLQLRLAELGCDVVCTAVPAEALGHCERWFPDLVLWGFPDDEDSPGPGAAARRAPDACVVLLHGGDRGDAAARAVRRGAHDILARDADDIGLGLMLHRTAERTRLHRRVRQLETEIRQGLGDRPIVAASPAMITLLEAIEHANGFDACLLLRGEVGTGKEGLARAAHAQSPRRSGPFIPVRCHGPEPAVERELFGRPAGPTPARRGRFIEANGGTLYLDGVEGLGAHLQSRLLATIASGQVTNSRGGKPWSVDVRIISGTYRDLTASVAAEEFDSELRRRLAAIELYVPALRERSEDVPLLVDHFFARARRELGRDTQGVADDALERLVSYTWPGNLRELQNVLEHAVLFARSDSVGVRDLPAHLERGDVQDPIEDSSLDLRRARKQLELDLIRRSLRRTGGNRTHAARLLQISHRALLYKIKEFDLAD